jgi:hypothetical protein
MRAKVPAVLDCEFVKVVELKARLAKYLGTAGRKGSVEVRAAMSHAPIEFFKRPSKICITRFSHNYLRPCNRLHTVHNIPGAPKPGPIIGSNDTHVTRPPKTDVPVASAIINGSVG